MSICRETYALLDLVKGSHLKYKFNKVKNISVMVQIALKVIRKKSLLEYFEFFAIVMGGRIFFTNA